MALYRCELKVYGRRTGGSAVKAAAYRSGKRGGNSGGASTKSALGLAAYRSCTVLKDDRTGERFDYTRKQHVEWTSILAPDGAPAWMRDRQKLWNAVEAREKRADAQLCREALLTLPRGLTREQRVALVRSFVQDAFVAEGMVADVAIHNPPASDRGEQPHAHVLLTMRGLDPDGDLGFGNKNRDWNGVDWNSNTARYGGFLRARRPLWQDYVNAALADAGSADTVDHRTRKERGLPGLPQPKLGKARHAKRGPSWVDGKFREALDVSAYNHGAKVGRAVARRARQLEACHGAEFASVALAQEGVQRMVREVTLHLPGHERPPDWRGFYGLDQDQEGGGSYER